MSDLVLDKNYKKGSKGKKVRLIQEWLCLQGIHIAVDGDFGPATHDAVLQFQKRKGLKTDGIVGKKTFGSLILPMTNALKDIPADTKSLGQMVVAYGERHLKQHPREIGGQNKRPWVHLYMRGNERSRMAMVCRICLFYIKAGL